MAFSMASFHEGVVLAFLATTLASCTKSIGVPRARVAGLAEYAATGSVIVDNGGREVRIERDMAPELTVQRSAGCSIFELSADALRRFFADSQCFSKTTFPLEQLRVDHEKIVLPAPSCSSASAIDIDAVGSVVLALDERGFLVTREELPRLLDYARSRDAVFEYGGRVFAVRPNHRPLLYIDAPQICGWSFAPHESCYGRWLVAALEQVRYSDRSLVVGGYQCPRDRLVEESEILSADITFGSDVSGKAERGRPTWALGANVAGPALLLSVTLQAFPVDRLALEAGVLPIPGVVGAWGGARVTAVRWGGLSWWVGGFGHASIAGGSSDASSTEKDRGLLAAGPRLGLEYVFPSKRHALLAEFDLIHASGPSTAWTRRDWIAWGGIGYSYLF
jgi:hypothetical protein